jgi:hypothetical protein
VHLTCFIVGVSLCTVGEDCDDTMDDVHSARLRERPKKDSSSLMSGKGLVSSSVVSISRIKRKRQGLQEIQVQVRGSIADELEDTTHDSEMGGSEDDDDLPPPPIPRRPAKSRPLGKVRFQLFSIFPTWRSLFSCASLRGPLCSLFYPLHFSHLPNLPDVSNMSLDKLTVSRFSSVLFFRLVSSALLSRVLIDLRRFAGR